MIEVEGLFDATWFGNTAWRWIVAAGIFVGISFVLLLLRRVIRSRYLQLAATPQTEFLELPLQGDGKATCPHTGDRYRLSKGRLSLV